jgi:hypothetical protein
MSAIPTAYISQRRKTPVHWLRITIGGAFALWALAVFMVEIARSLTHIDIPSAVPELELLFGMLYRVFPMMASVLYIPFHLYWGGAVASTADSIFLARKGISSDLLSITTAGMRRFVASRFFFVCRAYWAYVLLNAGVIWALAIYFGFENSRVTYFYLSTIRPRIIIEIARIPFFPELSELLIPAAIAVIASLGTLVLISACGVAAAATTPSRFSFAAGAISRLLVFGAAFGLLTFNRIRQSFDLIGPVIGMFLDGGLSHTGSYLSATYVSAQPGPLPPIYLIDRTGYLSTAPLYLIACIALAALILISTVSLLQRR